MNAARSSRRTRPAKPPAEPIDWELGAIGGMTATAAFNIQLFILLFFKPFGPTRDLVEPIWPILAIFAFIILSSTILATIHIAIIQKLETRNQKRQTAASVNKETL